MQRSLSAALICLGFVAMSDEARADFGNGGSWLSGNSQWFSESSDSGTSRESTDSSGTGDSSAPQRKLHVPLQARSEGAQWLTVRGTLPLLIKATLEAYRQLWRAEHGKACRLSDAELLTEILYRSEYPSPKSS